MKIIGLAGEAGSGKDTVAGIMLEYVRGERRAFADPLKRAAKEIFGLTDEQMADRGLKEQVIPYWGRSPRQILQLLGTECVREHFGRDTWLKCSELGLEHLSGLLTPPSVVVFSDVRFVEEAQWVRDQGGVVVRLRRNGLAAVSAHSSEAPLPAELVDFEVDNHGTRCDLRGMVSHCMWAWLKKAAPLRGGL